MVKLVWTSLIGELKTVYDNANGKGCQPVLHIIDELANTGVPNLDLHASTAVGRGMSLWMAVQSLSQLDAIYGSKRAETIRDNCDTQIFYRPANHATAKYLQDCLGFTSEFAHSKSSHRGEAYSEGEAETAVYLMTAQEVKGQDDEDIFIDYRNKRPIQAKRIDIRNFPELMAMTKIPPPPLLPIPDIKPIMSEETNHSATPYVNPDLIH
jgi:type IV secretory pathway TraG/TraD family ATPase VirD4